MGNQPHDIATRCAHAGSPSAEEREANAPFVPPIHQSTLFSLGDSAGAEALFSGERPGYTYTRFGNPTVDTLARALAELEGGAGCAVTASGNAATLCALTMARRKPDDRIVAPFDLYGGTIEVLRILAERYGAEVRFSDPRKQEEWLAAVRTADVVYVETPSNPLLRLVDLRATTEAARGKGARVIVDNTVATPYNQRPLDLGADYVVHSLSKYLNGHSDLIAGCVITRDGLTAAERSVHKNLGGTVNAIDAWLGLRGLRTFALRMEAHNRNAQATAEWLARHPSVSRVHYPGLPDHPQHDLCKRQMGAAGALMSFELAGDADAANRFIDALRLVVHGVSLGGMESLITRPGSTSHRGMSAESRQEAGISDNLIRLSVGVEAIDDILADLEQALSS